MLLEVKNLEVRYGGIRAVKGIDLGVAQGELVALIGANGAGKTSALKAICRLIPSSARKLDYSGMDLRKSRVHELPRRGLVMVPEGRGIFGQLTVQENLAMGAYARGRVDPEAQYAVFPRLKERRRQIAGTLSGGEQQMLAIARALMSEPRLLLLDEPSMGLAPQLVEEIFEIVVKLNAEQKVSILLAEQNTNMALRFAHYGYILENGRVVLDGSADELRQNEDVKEFYLGLSAAGRKSYREVKHYKRRKRWLA
jgi:branched-chain amino acid transport system ATP-binding protein